jgi:hypothetical protein
MQTYINSANPFSQSATQAVERGTFVTIEFLKSDGSIRKINGRTGVLRWLKNGPARSEQSKKDYFLVWTRSGSAKFDAPRHVARDRIISIKAEGYSVETSRTSAYARIIKA